jgi:hypothetical protein
MDNPRKARVAEQHFLNLPGFHVGAYVRPTWRTRAAARSACPRDSTAGGRPRRTSCSRSPT